MSTAAQPTRPVVISVVHNQKPATSVEKCFMDAARALLDEEDFEEILEMAKELADEPEEEEG